MKTVKHGQFVRVYDAHFDNNWTQGWVTSVHPYRPLLKVGALDMWFHVKQCRKIKERNHGRKS